MTMSNVFPAQKIKRTSTRTALIGQGQRMSNWLYNIAQEKEVPERYREEAKLLQQVWDRIIEEGRK
jgi:hypothetical protein